MEKIFITRSPEETEALGARLADRLKGFRCVALFGGLGSEGVASPTYTIVNEYDGGRRLCHFDMYRVEDADALYDIGWEDYLASGALCVVEWSEHVENALPADTVRVELTALEDGSRRIVVGGEGEGS